MLSKYAKRFRNYFARKSEGSRNVFAKTVKPFLATRVSNIVLHDNKTAYQSKDVPTLLMGILLILPEIQGNRISF